MGLFCELFGHRFEQAPDAEAVRSSDGALMVHEWTCRRCGTGARTFEPMDAFIGRIGEWALRSGGSVMSPPDWLGPPRPGKFTGDPETELRAHRRAGP